MKKRKPYKIKTRPKQKRAIDNILSGEYKSDGKAMQEAGYAKTTSRSPRQELLKRKGTHKYLKLLGKEAEKRFKKPLDVKVSEVFIDGLEASTLSGKEAIEHPDYKTRLAYAERLAKFMGWVESAQTEKPTYQQYNFFSVTEEKRKVFNKNFRKFLDRYYAK